MIREQIERVLKFLEPHLHFANCHMVDYFTQSSYVNYVPSDIRKEIHDLGQENFAHNYFRDDFSNAPNLTEFLSQTKNLTLKNSEICLQLDTFITKCGCDLNKFKLEVFMSRKKSHEVEILSSVAAAISKLSNTSHVVDIGDGKGYLSSMLALNHQISVLGVDASNINTFGAQKRAKKLSKVWNNLPNAPHKSLSKKNEMNVSENINLYKQVTEFVDENFNIEKLVCDQFHCSSPLNLALVGLHTCGDLAPTSLKIFCQNSSVKTICNVGCCYHLLSEFPLSQFLIDKKMTVGRSARMIANQSVDRVLATKELPNVTIFYRALLQIIIEKFGQKPTKHVGKFRKEPKNFLDYVRTALKRIDVEISITDEEIEDIFNLYQNRQNELNIFYLLRCNLAAVIETLILLDRLLFLKEQGFKNSHLVQLFDPVTSPRCYGIIAIK